MCDNLFNFQFYPDNMKNTKVYGLIFREGLAYISDAVTSNNETQNVVWDFPRELIVSKVLEFALETPYIMQKMLDKEDFRLAYINIRISRTR